jgi:outer membrane protein
MKRLVRLLPRLAVLVFAALLFAAPARAEVKIAVVDFESAIQRTNEFAVAKARFEGMQAEKQKNIEKMEQGIVQMRTDLQNQSGILSDTARRDKEAALQQSFNQYQQAQVSAQQELQQAYDQMMKEFIDKLKSVAETIGKEKSFTLVLEVSSVVYSANVPDITEEGVTRYNALHPMATKGK